LGIVKPNVVFFVSHLPLLYLFFLCVDSTSLFDLFNIYIKGHVIEEMLMNREKPWHRKTEINRMFSQPYIS